MIRTIDARHGDVRVALREIRNQLSPQGDVVSEEGRRKTVEVFGEPLSPQQVVARICHQVRAEGREALFRLTAQLDGAELCGQSWKVPVEQLERAHAEAAPEFLESVRAIQAQVLEFQKAILHRDVELRRSSGAVLRQRYVPLRRVGICVPGGAAAYPSTVLMTAAPAAAAGVAELAVVAPPTPFGADNPHVQAVCWELGIRDVHRVGGAQAVAALAYGVEGLPPVDKIVGPGNLFVALAKQFVFGEVDIDSIAGPSEVVVLADDTARADFVAADLLAQAEHSPGASLLVTWSEPLAERVRQELREQAAGLTRSALTLRSLERFGAVILVDGPDQGCEVTNLIAPEHLHIQTADPAALAERIRTAGATFLGPLTPVALGDYIAGPSHVLPTGGTARWASGLTANDFLRGGSVIEYSAEALRCDAVHVERMAEQEGLTAHRDSVRIRLAQAPPESQ